MAFINTPTPDGNKLIDYVKTRGKRGQRTIEILGRNLKFLDAFNTPVGFEILKDLCQMHEQMFDKIAALTASDEDKIRYKVLQELINRWSESIAAYYSTLEVVEKVKI